MNFLTAFLMVLQYQLTLGQLSAVREELKHWCLKGKYHKAKPGPESKLHQQCTPWKDHSCCSYEGTVSLHENESHYRFTRNHCGQLSEECNRHFIQDLCFYECEPNLGPWIAKEDRKFRKERFFHVPLCASDCDKWFSACAEDKTCVENWMTEFRRENETNVCPRGKPCRMFKDIYQNASNFCEKVWDSSLKYTPDDQPCMRLWFNGSKGNPNERVADIRIDMLLNAASLCLPFSQFVLIQIVFLTISMKHLFKS